MKYLNLRHLLAMVEHEGLGPIRDIGLLDSATTRPRASAFGEDAYKTLDLKAAALMHSVAKNHALVDGNKRLALLATVVLLRVNGYESTLDQKGAVQLVLDVAASDLELDEIATRLAIQRRTGPTASASADDA